MTNNLKILTILSIFVFILTGYFYFSSPSVKNQIIVNNNEEENNKTTGINNEDGNKKDNREKTSKLSILKIIIIVILIIIVGVIVFIIVDKFRKKSKEDNINKFQFEESEKDFAKENFCPTFFTIHIPKVTEKSKEKGIEIDDTKEDADSFFEILASFLIPKDVINRKDKVEISLSSNENKRLCHGNVESKYTIRLKDMLDEINNFASLSKHLNTDREIMAFIKPLKNNVENVKSKIKESKAKIEEIEKKYGEEFDSYLCAYLLYYLSETIGNKIKVEISDPKKEEGVNKYINIRTNFIFTLDSCETSENVPETYKVNYDMINEILKKLTNDNQLQNVTYKEF